MTEMLDHLLLHRGLEHSFGTRLSGRSGPDSDGRRSSRTLRNSHGNRGLGRRLIMRPALTSSQNRLPCGVAPAETPFPRSDWKYRSMH
jgi:hypothetical protein